MNRLAQKQSSAQRRSHRVRTIIKRNSTLPRLSVSISNRQVSAQIIEPNSGKVLVSANSLKQKDGSLTDKAQAVGKNLAQAAKKAKITKVAFDRGAKLYHGRIKALAEAARSEGMEL